ncbi:MAG: TMEM43 family protein [Kiritimatiellae bacterium]|nr:TMEM43 family protein [Kiritimatiellia bacterium]
MADTFTTTTRTSYGSRLGSSLKGIGMGLVVFLVGFPVLFWNEGRAVKRTRALKEGEKNVVPVESGVIDPANEGKLVHFTGRAVTDAVLADPVFGVSVTGDLQLVRTAEMYQWTEEVREETKKNVGGSETTKTTYNYTKQWSSSLEDSSSFEHAKGHENPADFAFPEESWLAEDVRVGAFAIPSDRVRAIGAPMSLPLAADAVPAALPTNATRLANGWYIPTANGGGTPQAPQVGDERVTFAHVPQTDVSFVAKQVGSTIAPYLTKNGPVLLQQDGVRSADEMFASAHSSNKIVTWLLRLLGFILLFAGLSAVLRPIRVLADVLPFLGRIVGMGLGFVAFVVALVCWLVTVAVAWVAYRPLVGIPLLVAAAALVFLLVKRSREARTAS